MSHAALRKESRRMHAEKVRSYGGHTDEAQDRKMIESAVRQHEAHDHPGKSKTKLHLASGGSVDGDEAPSRPDRPSRRASGGSMGGGSKGHSTKGTHVNVIVAPRGADPASAPAAAPPMPAMPPRAMPPGMPPGGMPGGGMPPGMPGAAGPMSGGGGKPFKRGGKVEMEGSAAGGLGRLEKSVSAKAKGDLKENTDASDPDEEDKPVYDGLGMEKDAQQRRRGGFVG